MRTTHEWVGLVASCPKLSRHRPLSRVPRLILYQRRVLAMSSPSEMITVPKQDDWPAMIKSTLERALRS